ncbi:unnamed protein product [Penicillium glandicola]
MGQPKDAVEDAMLPDASPGLLRRWRKKSAAATIAVNIPALNRAQNAMVAVTQQDAGVLPTTHVPPRQTAVMFRTTNHPEDVLAAAATQSVNQSTSSRWKHANAKHTHLLPTHLPCQVKDTTPSARLDHHALTQ